MFRRATFFWFLCFKISALVSLESNAIQEIYEKYVSVNFTKEYRNRYKKLPIKKNQKPWKWEKKDFARVIAVLEFERFVQEKHLSSEKALLINPVAAGEPEWSFLPHNAVVKTDFEADPIKYDLHTLNLDDKDFDFVMANQTLEHVYDPLLCLKNLYAHMRGGGDFIFQCPCQ